MTVFDNLPLGRKLAAIGLAALVALCVAAALFGMQAKRQMTDDRLQQLRALVDTTVGVAAALEAQVQAGKLTHEQALGQFVADAMAMRYGNGSGYVFVNTMDGMTLANANTKIIGTNQIDVVTNGVNITRGLIDGIRQSGEVVLHYSYTRPGSEVLSPKVAYGKGFAPWSVSEQASSKARALSSTQ